MHGGGLQLTGHVVDFVFIEVVLGGMGGSLGGRSLYEVPILAGVRLMGPVGLRNLRLYGALDIGITIRGVGGGATWGAFPIDAGGGIELGLPTEDNFTVGLFLDARAAVRVPFEREPVFVGVSWSGGLAIMWL